jgi:hypothetical protein
MTSRTKRPGQIGGADSRAGLPGMQEAKALIDAMLRAASERRHSLAQTARSLGITDVHWGRLRRRPELLSRCDRPLLERIAYYVGWPLLNVYVAAGILSWNEVSAALYSGTAVRDVLHQIVRTPLGAAVKTPLKDAAADHQMLIGMLFLSAQQVEIWKLMQLP